MIDKIFTSRINKKLLVILHDLFMVMLAWQLAWWSRFNFEFPFFNWHLSIALTPILLVVQFSLFWRFRLYRALWRFASLLDLWNISKASIAGSIITALALFILFRLEGIPRSVILLYPIFLIFLLGGARLGYRLWKDRNTSILSAMDKRRVLVIGGGSAGDMLVRDFHRSKADLPVAILDDNNSLIGAEIRGVKIVGLIKDVDMIVKQLNVDWIAIAIPSAGRSEMQIIVEECEKTNLPIRTLPSIRNLSTNQDLVSGLKEVSIEDILGREQVKLDWGEIQNSVRNKCVMVTGGGGSIGSVLASQIATLSPSKLILIDNSEYNLYKTDLMLRAKNFHVDCLLGDVCDSAQMNYLFNRYKPQLVFHAAAYKHVPILQAQPREALKNNIQGTKIVLDIACKSNVEKFVLISTDKAVNPSNILGVSKRVAELYTESMNHIHETQCITVRFGNVLDSAGSVVPLFREQIKNGGPITVTHAEITRYFMTISEATQLILQSAAMGRGGEIFVLDMGEPVSIQYLAEQMILLSGKKLGEDIDITYCGLRPGEKLYEELFYESEEQSKTAHQKIFLAKHSEINASRCAGKINALINEKIEFVDDDLLAHMFDFLSLCAHENKNDRLDNVVHIKN